MIGKVICLLRHQFDVLFVERGTVREVVSDDLSFSERYDRAAVVWTFLLFVEAGEGAVNYFLCLKGGLVRSSQDHWIAF